MEKNKKIAILLSFLLGYLGVDRFYLGYYGMGVLKLLTLGGVGIWWLIDFIFIYTGNLTIKNKNWNILLNFKKICKIYIKIRINWLFIV